MAAAGRGHLTVVMKLAEFGVDLAVGDNVSAASSIFICVLACVIFLQFFC